ncbi:MAG: hypothetical protein K2R98_32980 [Gemmataceae bacterium]|nr:hypothetical protein [Gemmataceae bacterium]
MSTALQPVDFPPAARRSAFFAGALGLTVIVALGLWRPAHSFRSYLVAFLAWLALPLGCLALTMLHHLTGGRWGMALRHIWHASVNTLPLLALLFVPLLVGMGYLYPWAQPEVVADDEVLRTKQLYLNVPFFVVRAGFYFACWLVLAYFLNRWARRSPSTADGEEPRCFRLLSGPGLALMGLTVTFAAIDWAMSLEPHWFSSIYGVMFANGQLLAALAFAVLLTLMRGPRLDPDVQRDLGNLLMAFTMLWAYLAFAQLLLIWSGNLPEEIPWYLRRLDHGWQWVALSLLLLQFVVPFMLLLSRAVKRDPRKLATVAALILAMRFVDMWWTVAPAFPSESPLWRCLDLAAVVGIGGIWLGVFLGALRTTPPDLVVEELPHA